LQLFDVQGDADGTIRFITTFDSTRSSPPTFKVTVEFPDLTDLSDPVCARAMKLGVACQPKHFEAQFGNAAPNRAVLTADIGIPGFVVLKDTTFTVEQNSDPVVQYGKFEFCNALEVLFSQVLKTIAEALRKSLGLKAITLSLEHIAAGFHFEFDFQLPDAPLGGGTLRPLAFSLGWDLKIDAGRSGKGRGMFLAFALGRFRLPRFAGVDWPNLTISSIPVELMRWFEPVELIISPFVFRFGSIAGFRILPNASFPEPTKGGEFHGVGEVEVGSFFCVVAEAGLAKAFSNGIVRAEASIAITIRYCPSATLSLQNGLQLCLTKIGIGVVVDAQAAVAEVVSVTVHAEIVATLQIACSKPSEMICGMVFAVYASVEIFFAKIEYHATVNLDEVFHFHCCTTGACAENRLAPATAEARAEEVLAEARTRLDEFYHCWECAA
jgi:hypothetical protein